MHSKKRAKLEQKMKKRIFKLYTPGNRKQFEPKEKKGGKRPVSPGYFQACKLRSSRRWQDLSRMFLARFPLCEICSKPAEEIHHIEGASKKPELFFRVDNLAGLCCSCHYKIEAALKRGIKPEELFPKDKRKGF
jgi:hypothetical protein